MKNLYFWVRRTINKILKITPENRDVQITIVEQGRQFEFVVEQEPFTPITPRQLEEIKLKFQGVARDYIAKEKATQAHNQKRAKLRKKNRKTKKK